MALGLTVAAGIGAFLLFVPIATLLITQLMMAASNITTLESFVPGMDEKVCRLIVRKYSIKVLQPQTFSRFSDKIVGSSQLNQYLNRNKSIIL